MDPVTEPGVLRFSNLIKRSDVSQHNSPFLQEIQNARERAGDLEQKAIEIKRFFSRRNQNCGHSCISYSLNHDTEREVLVTALMVNILEDSKRMPVIVPIDDFYRYAPGNSSLVRKTELSNDEIEGISKYVIVLTGFTESAVFTRDILEQVPFQANAGLTTASAQADFGKKLSWYAGDLGGLIFQKKGYLPHVLDSISQGKKEHMDNARLLLATSLLLQDKQLWQNLWYETKGEGTSLCIVAPQSFHDAMNRLNWSWGHGRTDYHTRASISTDEPIFCEESLILPRYEEQGLDYNQFRKRIEHLL